MAWPRLLPRCSAFSSPVAEPLVPMLEEAEPFPAVEPPAPIVDDEPEPLLPVPAAEPPVQSDVIA